MDEEHARRVRHLRNRPPFCISAPGTAILDTLRSTTSQLFSSAEYPETFRASAGGLGYL